MFLSPFSSPGVKKPTYEFNQDATWDVPAFWLFDQPYSTGATLNENNIIYVLKKNNINTNIDNNSNNNVNKINVNDGSSKTGEVSGAPESSNHSTAGFSYICKYSYCQATRSTRKIKKDITDVILLNRVLMYSVILWSMK